MFHIIVTNCRTKENRILDLHEGRTLNDAADYIVKRIEATYPKAYKLVHNAQNHITIMAGNVTKAVFDLKVLENLKDYDDEFLC